MNQRFDSEAALGTAVRDWLRADGWVVYGEVQPGRAYPIADIVAVRDNIYWWIECKLRLNLRVIWQAIIGRHYAHYASCAVSRTSKQREAVLLNEILKHHGVGLVVFSSDDAYESVHPCVNRRPIPILADTLHPEQLETVPGSTSGAASTPFNRTARALVQFVAAHPGCSMRDAINTINHHYRSFATARSSLSKWIRAGIIKGIEHRDGALWPEVKP